MEKKNQVETVGRPASAVYRRRDSNRPKRFYDA